MLHSRTPWFVFLVISLGSGASHAGSRPELSVVGSLEGTYIDNAFFTPEQRRDDVYWAPDITVRLDGAIAQDVYYRLYARMEFDAFSKETDANNSVARVGARVSRYVGDWMLGLIYENRYAFDGLYENRLFTAHDFKASAATTFEYGLAIFSPGGLITYRHADLDEVKRYRAELWLGIEVPLDERWSLVSEPFYEALWFTEGLNSGRQDHIYSISLGMRYALSDTASLTTELVYEGRSSNQAGRDYDMIEFGPRLDFAF